MHNTVFEVMIVLYLGITLQKLIVFCIEIITTAC